ncbi:MAG TPA: alpha/beta fold hydrolase [Longimicrobiales bacterium]|nr:alpha/beta fold hydrolase [Longimicrobiales bacterium]
MILHIGSRKPADPRATLPVMLIALAVPVALAVPALLSAQTRGAATESAKTHTHRDVRIATPDPSVTLAGTLSLPGGRTGAPVVIFLTGSGDHSRDQVISGTPMFQVLAEHLLGAGFATLRLDDRGTGESTGPATTASTTADRVTDMTAAVAWMAGSGDAGSIILFGHSEGASVAAAVAGSDDRVEGVVLLGAPALAGSVVWMDQQMAGIAEHLQRDVAELDDIRGLLQRIIDLSVGGAAPADVESHTVPFFAAIGLDLDTAREDGTLANFVARLSSPWFRHFLAHDPAADYQRIEAPVLAIYGSLDRLTSPALNLPVLAGAVTSNSDVTLRIVPEQDHFFLRSDELPAGQHRFGIMHVAPELPAELIRWLQARFIDR